ncbi:MAG: hypothetical protein WBC69_03530 [Geitlerinemataceae cyanobacterium]
MTLTDEQFTQAEQQWDLETLYLDLASAKGRRLTPVEKLHLRGLLCGYSPAEIADKLHKSVKGVEAEVSVSVYRYVKSLIGKCTEKVENWRNITEWLEDAGYKTELSVEEQIKNSIPVDILGKIANIRVENDKITIEIDLRKANSRSPQPEPEEVENEPSNGLM